MVVSKCAFMLHAFAFFKQIIHCRAAPVLVRFPTGHATALKATHKAGRRGGDIRPLRKSKSVPDPLSKDEFIRLPDATKHEQIRNIWIFAVSSGMRLGEICALVWEDVDIVNWNVKVNQNLDFNAPQMPHKKLAGIE